MMEAEVNRDEALDHLANLVARQQVKIKKYQAVIEELGQFYTIAAARTDVGDSAVRRALELMDEDDLEGARAVLEAVLSSTTTRTGMLC